MAVDGVIGEAKGNTSASCTQHTALVEKAPNRQHRGPNPLLKKRKKHLWTGKRHKSGRPF